MLSCRTAAISNLTRVYQCIAVNSSHSAVAILCASLEPAWHAGHGMNGDFVNLQIHRRCHGARRRQPEHAHSGSRQTEFHVLQGLRCRVGIPRVQLHRRSQNQSSCSRQALRKEASMLTVCWKQCSLTCSMFTKLQRWTILCCVFVLSNFDRFVISGLNVLLRFTGPWLLGAMATLAQLHEGVSGIWRWLLWCCLALRFSGRWSC